MGFGGENPNRPSHHIMSRIHAMNMTYHCRCWQRSCFQVSPLYLLKFSFFPSDFLSTLFLCCCCHWLIKYPWHHSLPESDARGSGMSYQFKCIGNRVSLLFFKNSFKIWGFLKGGEHSVQNTVPSRMKSGMKFDFFSRWYY